MLHEKYLYSVHIPSSDLEVVRMANYCAYYRVSTRNQGASGLGLSAQKDAVNRFLKPGDLVTAEFREIESGKRHENRPELAAALECCRRQNCILLIATLDRLARNVHFISGLMETSVPFMAADRPNAAAFEIHIFAAMAEEERRKISARVKAALAVKREALAKEGKKLGNPRPLEALKLAVAAKRKALNITPGVMRLVVNRHYAKKSFWAIAAELNELGIKTPYGKSRWYASNVRQQLNRLHRMADEDAAQPQPAKPIKPAPRIRPLDQDDELSKTIEKFEVQLKEYNALKRQTP